MPGLFVCNSPAMTPSRIQHAIPTNSTFPIGAAHAMAWDCAKSCVTPWLTACVAVWASACGQVGVCGGDSRRAGAEGGGGTAWMSNRRENSTCWVRVLLHGQMQPSRSLAAARRRPPSGQRWGSRAPARRPRCRARQHPSRRRRPRRRATWRCPASTPPRTPGRWRSRRTAGGAGAR
jgi:hypothetical protein